MLITLAFLVLYRLGFQLHVPGTGADQFYSILPPNTLGISSFLFGGAFGTTALFALGVLPHLAGLAVARVSGRAAVRIPTAILVGLATALLLYLPVGLQPTAILGFVAGSALVGWIAQRIERSGVGYGVPILIASNFVATTGHAVVVLSGTDEGPWGIARILIVPVILGTLWITLTAVAAAWSHRHPIASSRA